jgi:hypothetical protein
LVAAEIASAQSDRLPPRFGETLNRRPVGQIEAFVKKWRLGALASATRGS